MLFFPGDEKANGGIGSFQPFPDRVHFVALQVVKGLKKHLEVKDTKDGSDCDTRS